MRRALHPGMRIASLACMLFLTGCIDEREPYEADPLIAIASLRCEIAGAQIVLEGTFDVRLQEGQLFRVDQLAALGPGTKATMYSYFGCNEWKTVPDGCIRLEGQPETQPVSLRRTENVTTGTLPDAVRVEVAGVVETDDMPVVAKRTLTCTR